MSRNAFSAFAGKLAIGDLAGPARPCLGVDIHSVSGAPGDELIRIEVGAYHDPALLSELALAFFGSVLPLVVGPMEPIVVRHDLEDSGVILATIPGHADADPARKTASHSLSPSVVARNTTVAEAAGDSIPGGRGISPVITGGPAL